MAAIRVLIAEDETMMRRLLERRLSQEDGLEVVGEAEDGRQAVELAASLRPDVIVMDLQMPGLNGIQATERILAKHSHMRVVMLTALEELSSLGRISGASECLNKSCTPEELVAAIRRAHASKLPEVAASAPRSDYGASVARIAVRSGLSERERAVLEKVVSTELTVHQIARELSKDTGESVTESSVKHALERVMNKLRVEPRTRGALVRLVLEGAGPSPSPEGD